MSADDLASAVTTEAAKELASALERIQHCANQLSDDQVWSRERDDMNSVGNLILHLTGNVQQWLVVGLGGGADARNRPAEFAERGPIAKQDLLRRLESVVAAARNILGQQTARDLTTVRRIQGFETTGLAAIFNSVPHFRGHTQEIIRLTRAQLGAHYHFAWQPSTPEQGA